mmetsp:Transcript_22313/g.66124  ORF Transcript_22313/g.66124 Transcript_22313/m.66124 type:complete len:203 (-) Transcript_22313:161-769(-)
MRIPSYRVARTGWFSESVRYSGGTDSIARDRLSDVSSRLLAKDVTANDLAAPTSRLAMRRVFSCSARLRRSWSLRSFTWDSSSSSLDGSGGTASPPSSAEAVLSASPVSGDVEAPFSSTSSSGCWEAFPASLKRRAETARKETGRHILCAAKKEEEGAGTETEGHAPVATAALPCRTSTLPTAILLTTEGMTYLHRTSASKL